MMAIWFKKVIYILSLAPGLAIAAPITSTAAPVATPAQIEEIRSENELDALEVRFQEDQNFNKDKVNEILRIRAIEAGSIAPLKKNIDAMLILWDAGVRDQDVFIATLLKDTKLDQTLVTHLYGQEVRGLLNELSSNDGAPLSENAQQIQASFDTLDQPL